MITEVGPLAPHPPNSNPGLECVAEQEPSPSLSEQLIGGAARDLPSREWGQLFEWIKTRNAERLEVPEVTGQDGEPMGLRRAGNGNIRPSG